MKYCTIAALVVATGLPSPAGVTMTALTSFGGGDGWRAPTEVVAGDAAGTATTPGVYNYLGTASNERGMAYNSVLDRLILCSRAGSLNIRQLDPLTGQDYTGIPTTGISGGTFTASLLSCGNDGALYAANLTTNAASTAFKVYKWDDVGSAPAVFFEGTTSSFAATARLGDSFDMMDGPAGPVVVAGAANTVGYLIATGPATSLTVKEFTGASPPAAQDFRPGITFAGDVTKVWGRQTSGATRRTSYGTTQTGVAEGNITITTGAQGPMDYAVVNGRPLLALVNVTTSMVSVYDVTDPGAATLAASMTTTSGTLSGNGNLAGTVKWGAISGTTAKLYAMATNQGIQAFTVTVTSDVEAPVISSSPGNRTVYERGQTTLTVTATGTPPFTYQWLKGTDPVAGAPNAPNYTINPVSAASEGTYTCHVTNSAGAADSAPATITVAPSVNSPALTPLWSLAPGSRPWISASGDTERGVDYNPVTNRVYVVSRSPSPQVYVLDGTTHADLGQLNVTGVTGGNFVLMFPGACEDGVVYACNLSSTADGSSFKIYKWDNDSAATVPVAAYDGNPVGSRIGDSFDVSGTGAAVRCVAGARNTNQFVIFTQTAPNTLSATPIAVTGAPNGAFGLGVSFGEGNTVWGHGDGGPLYYCSYDLATGTGQIIASYNAAGGIPAANVNPVSVDPANRLIAMLDTGNSDNVRLYSYSEDPVPVLTLLDQEFLSTDNANPNRVGSLYTGAGRVIALDANNGVAAYSVINPLGPVLGAVTRTSNISFTLQLSGTPGFNYVVENSADLTPGSWAPLVTVPFANPVETVPLPLDAGRMFFRARLGP